MKIVLLVFIFALSYCNGQFMAATNTCVAELKLAEKDVKDFYKMMNGHVSPTMQCYVKCVMEKLGELKNGMLDTDKAIKNWKELPELAEFHVTDPKVFAKCKSEKGASDCETAYKFVSCILHNKTKK